jgi:hypothetical protein
MGMNWAEHSTEIDAPIETSFDAIVDYESFPGWQDAVDSVEVLSRTGDGLGENVRLFVDAKVKKIDYTLRYSYDRPTEIRWDFVEGNGMRDVDGVYTLESIGPERTRATYKLGADPEVPVPGMVLRRTHKALVKRSVEDLKGEAERRHAAGASAGPAETREAPAAQAEPAETTNEPAPAPQEAAGDEWAPKAEREPPATSSGGPDPNRGSLENAVRAGRDVIERGGKTAFDVAEGVASRIDRLFGRGR